MDTFTQDDLLELGRRGTYKDSSEQIVEVLRVLFNNKSRISTKMDKHEKLLMDIMTTVAALMVYGDVNTLQLMLEKSMTLVKLGMKNSRAFKEELS